MNSQRPLELSILSSFPMPDESNVDEILEKSLKSSDKKIVVLDDDPTGVQTVHDISVFTDWSKESIKDGFLSTDRMFFILTNSRGLTVPQTTETHREIAKNLSDISILTGIDFILMSRSDSTLRGHYPLETEILRAETENALHIKFDGEIIIPFFKEGSRFTIGNVHYVREGDLLIPAAQTEFAKDKSFGYRESDLTRWCEEKTGGAFKAEDVTCITLESLRNGEIEKISDQLMKVKDFNKVIVNAVDYVDLKVFSIAYLSALSKGKRFMFRCAASITKVLGGVKDRPLLSRNELIAADNNNGGIIIIGSHVNKTSQQLEALKGSSSPLKFIEFDQHLVLKKNGLANEVARVVKIAEEFIKTGTTAVIYTRRERLDLDTADKDAQLAISVEISDAVTSIVEKLCIRPNFIIAKGGITSSDVGTKALKVKRAVVKGQVKPGIPVWMTGPESKFPGMPFIIFPGNVGEKTTLREVAEMLVQK